MSFVLKTYQQRCLDELGRYLHRTWELKDADTAFYEQTRRPYYPIKALQGLPYVCVRVPTGGGKTVLAAHAVGLAAEKLLRADHCLTLWLAPTTQIVEQTRKALEDRRHPYREALDRVFSGRVTVIDMKAAFHLQRGTLDTDAVVIVSTMAALRVDNTEDRKIYDDNGQIMSHFDGLKEEQKTSLQHGDGGEPPTRSLANILRLRRPIIIVDEAHNARTPLSFESLARFNPACIIEFTATPSQENRGGNEPSNVLTHVSAAELKYENMIKMPIYLKPKPQWTEAVQNALDKQTELETLAKEEEKITGQYIRPIVLFQAQRKGENHITYEVLKKALIEEFRIPEDRIAISTGAQNDIEDVNVLTRECPIRYIITVDKLREGWDCPFAYILCTVSSLSSSTAVEQILGRILRLPYATKRQHDELNRAYAFATSNDFVESANSLVEALVESGFNPFEAKTMVKPAAREEMLPLFCEPVSEAVSEKADLKSLPRPLREKVSLRIQEDRTEIVYQGPPMTGEEVEAIKSLWANRDDKKAVDRLSRKSHGQEYSPAALGESFRIPQLTLQVEGERELFEDQFRETPWKLSDCEPTLTENDFSPPSDTVKIANVDIDGKGKIAYSFITDLEKQLSLLELHGPQTAAELAIWLDQHIPHPDIIQNEASIFLGNVIRSLIEKRSFTLESLIAQRWRLRDAVEDKISHYRRQVIDQAYQRYLSPDFEPLLEVDPTFCFTFDAVNYPATRFYEGRIKFSKHYYSNPAHMNQEEEACAAFIDNLPAVEYWVRNLERNDYSFWLPTSTDRFYPDFVALLKDGRILVVEYKGGHLAESSDTKEKTMVGQIWATRSNGRCLFLMVEKNNYQNGITAAIRT